MDGLFEWTNDLVIAMYFKNIPGIYTQDFGAGYRHIIFSPKIPRLFKYL